MCNIQTWEEMEQSREWDDYNSMAKEYAWRHCQAALKAAAETKIQDKYVWKIHRKEEDKVSILNAYDKKLIQ